MTNGSWHVIMSNILGGVSGIFLFTFLGSFLESIWLKMFPKRNISENSKYLSYIKNKFSIWGISLISPIISFPVGIVIALTVTTNKWEIIKKMTISLVGWSFILYLIHFIIIYL